MEALGIFGVQFHEELPHVNEALVIEVEFYHLFLVEFVPVLVDKVDRIVFSIFLEHTELEPSMSAVPALTRKHIVKSLF